MAGNPAEGNVMRLSLTRGSGWLGDLRAYHKGFTGLADVREDYGMAGLKLEEFTTMASTPIRAIFWMPGGESGQGQC